MTRSTGAFVVQQPNSNTNPSDEYRVVHSTDFAQYINGAKSSLPVAFSSSDYQAAGKKRDELNQEQARLNR